MVRAASRALLDVINDLLDFAKIDAGRLELDPHPFALRQSLDEALGPLTFRARGKGLEFCWRVDDDVPDLLLADWPRLRQVLLNLTGNALKFTERGNVTVAVGMQDPGRQTPGGGEGCPQTASLVLRFSVVDTGIGIPPEKLSLVFEPFVQADGSTTRKYGGTGLGLSISTKLAAIMGGRVSVASTPGVGSTFTLAAPVELAGAGHEHGEDPSRTPAPPRCRPLHLLIAEDNPVNQKLVLRLLEKHGHSGEVAADGRAALTALAHGSYDGVLMDIQMPQMDGLEVTKHFRATEAPGRHLPIVAMTAHARAGDHLRCLEAGMDAYLAKPLDAGELLRTLAESIAPSGTSPARRERLAPERPHLEVFNVTVALDRVGGDRQLLRELGDLCLANMPGWLADVRSALAARDAVRLRRAAHTIKGAVGSIGGDEAAAASARLEERGRASLFEGIGPDLVAVEQALARLESVLRQVEPDPPVHKETTP
jgi:CheY-like chemotaxis protein